MKFITRTSLLIAFTLFSQVAFAASDLVVQKVELTKASDYVEFSFHLNQPVKPSALSARRDGTLMVFTLPEAKTARQWITSTDDSIRRVLLHESRADNSAALRVRYFKTVPQAVLKNIRVRVNGSILIAAVPHTAEIAGQWATHAQVKEKVAAKTVAETKKADEDTVSEEDIAIAPIVPEPSTSIEQTKEESQKAVPSEAGIAATERSNTPTLIIAMIMMLGVGFVLLKKMKQMKPSAEGGPLIRPIGTHMLGPKQGLLLVDVAGEMVLLGTTDKGVQLLTKLDGTGIEDAERRASDAALEAAAAPSANVENPFGKMLGQFREASAKLKTVTSGVSQTAGQLSKAGEELNLLAGDDKQYDRRQFRPLTPRAPVPPYQAQTSLQERDELIEKLRMLKGA
jgi:flagellar biogenesis protein FliO